MEGKLLKRAIVITIVFFLLASLPPITHANITPASTTNSTTNNTIISMKVDPSLLNSSKPVERIIVLGTGSPQDLKNYVSLQAVYPLGSAFMAVGFSNVNNIKSLALEKNVLRIVPDIKLNYSVPKQPNAGDNQIQPDLYNARNILGVNQATQAFGVNGTGVNVAIVDTGTFFGNPDLQNSIARDSSGRPIYMDADGMSLGVTGLYFFANLTGGKISNWSSNIPYPFNGPLGTGSVYVSNGVVYLGSQGMKGAVYATSYGIYNGEPFIPYVIPENVTIGTVNDFIKPAVFNYTYNNVTLQVGVYAFGFLSMPLITDGYYDYLGLKDFWKYGLTVVPTLVIPSVNPDVFDTVYITGWNTYLYDLGYSTDPFSFVMAYYDTLENPHHTNDSTIFLSYYDPADGIYVDFGTIGGNTLLPNITGTSPLFFYMYGAYSGDIISGITPDGLFYSNLISFDYGEYHGTFTASVVASHGIIPYNLYNNGTYYKLQGIAPGAKIISIPALYLGDVFYGWMWAAGFDYNSTTMTWVYTGDHRAQIESNSWGISEWPILMTGIGYDAMSALEDALMLPGVMAPDYPGTVFVHAMGNGGPGYGTDTSPGGALIPITVGASTSSDWIRAYGWGVSHTSGQVIEWSDRGPAYTGDIKPDVVAVGAFSWVPASINYWEGLPWLPPGVGIFGGTSQATPMTAGVAALVVQAMMEKHMTFDPIYVKNVLMNTAVDLYNAPYTQGSGQVNAYYAVATVLGNSSVGGFTTTSYATYQNVMAQISAAISYWQGLFGGSEFPSSVPMANWFAGYLTPGSSAQNTFTISNPTNSTIYVTPGSQILSLVGHKSITLTWNTTGPGLYSWVRGFSGPYYSAEYINFTAVFGQIPSNVDMVAITINTPYQLPAGAFNIPGFVTLYVYDWNGVTMNVRNYFGNVVQVPRSSTMNLVNDGYNWYNTQIVTINMHANPFTMYPLIRTYMYNVGDISSIYPDPWDLPFTLNVYYFQETSWNWINVPSTQIAVPAHGTATFNAILNVPSDASNGVYSGYVTVTGANGFKELIPTSVAVVTNVDKVNSVYSFGGNDKYSQIPLYSNGIIYGMGSLDWRYESGDVRFYYLDVTNTGITGLNIQMVWNDPGTSVDLFVLDPYGFIIGSTVPLLWNYLGAGFFAPSYNMLNGTSLTVPTDGTGIYTIVVHQTSTGGEIWPVEISGTVSTLGITISGLKDYMYGNANVNYQVASPIPIKDLYYSIDNGPLVPLQINGLAFASGTIPIDLTKLSAGQHSITIIMVDSYDFEFKASSVFVDVGAPPVVTITSPSNNEYVSGTVNVQWNVAGLYISNVEFTVDGIPYNFQNNQYTLDTTKLTDGPHTIQVMATNMAGYSGSQSITVIVNNNVPFAQFISPTNNEFVKGTVNVTFVVTGDYIKNVALSVDNEVINVTNNYYLLDTTKLSDGSHVLKLTVTTFGGKSYVTSESINVLNTPPTVSITSPSSGSLVNGTITINFSYSNANSVWLYIDNYAVNVTGLNSYTYNTSLLSDGNHTIKVVANNFAGSSSSLITIKTNNQYLVQQQQKSTIGSAVSQAYYVGIPIGVIVGLVIGIAIGYYTKSRKKQ